MMRLFERFSLVIYGLVTGTLMLASVAFVLSAWMSVGRTVITGGEVTQVLLRSIGLLVVALAVFDVAKFLWEEEVVRDKELRSATESRRTLTKFLTILIIALSLEALVFVFDFGKDDVSTLIYPSVLLTVTVLMLVGLAAYQRIMRAAEQMDASDDPDNADIEREKQEEETERDEAARTG